MIYFYINCKFFHGFQLDMFAVSCSQVVHAVVSVARFDPHFGARCPKKKKMYTEIAVIPLYLTATSES